MKKAATPSSRSPRPCGKRTRTPAAELCRKLGVSETTFYAWKKKYAGVGIAELRRVKSLEAENRRLKEAWST